MSLAVRLKLQRERLRTKAVTPDTRIAAGDKPPRPARGFIKDIPAADPAGTKASSTPQPRAR